MTNRLFLAAAILVAGCARPGPSNDTANPGNVVSSPADTAAARADSQRAAGDTVAPSDTGVTVRLEGSTFKAGDEVTLRIVNATASQLAYNPCTRVIERQDGSRWVALEEQRMCTMIAHILNAKSARTEKTELASPMPAGRYRLIVPMTVEGSGAPSRSIRATSPTFTVS